MYQELAAWIDNLDLQNIPDEVAAFSFNLYDGCDDEHWSMELIGADSFDPDDSDWACCEVCDFGSREAEYQWTEQADWETVFAESVTLLKQYLDQGKHARTLKSRTAVAVGFVDGDLEILYSKT